MSQFYVACHLGGENGLITLGHLHKGEFQVSEVRRFPILPVVDRECTQWDIPQLYQEILEGLKTVGAYEEPVEAVSCISVPGDYVLFDNEGALITPATHHSDPKTRALGEKMSGEIPWQMIYEETGSHKSDPNLFLQLGLDKRVKKASYVLPLADGFNFLLGGEPRIELSMASATQLYNPVLKRWSERLLDVLKIPAHVLPPVATPGTVLGNLKPDICKETHLEDTRVIAAYSEQMAAALAGLPVGEPETWAFVKQGPRTVVGTLVPQPVISEDAQHSTLANQLASEGSVCFHKRSNGLFILEECQRYWEQKDRSLDPDLLSHLAGSSTPFESLVDPDEPRFLAPGDMPLKIQAYCKETGQPVPRKPGPIYRCVLESLALHYRKLVYELEHFAGVEMERIYVFAEHNHSLLNHFTANALQLPVTVAPPTVLGAGSVVAQALALQQVHSLEEGRALLQQACKVETIVPHASVWDQAYYRFVALSPEILVPSATEEVAEPAEG